MSNFNGNTGSSELTDGSADIYVNSVKINNISTPFLPLKTDGDKQIYSTTLDIDDISGLQTALDSTIQTPYNGTIQASDFRSDNVLSYDTTIPLLITSSSNSLSKSDIADQSFVSNLTLTDNTKKISAVNIQTEEITTPNAVLNITGAVSQTGNQYYIENTTTPTNNFRINMLGTSTELEGRNGDVFLKSQSDKVIVQATELEARCPVKTTNTTFTDNQELVSKKYVNDTISDAISGGITPDIEALELKTQYQRVPLGSETTIFDTLLRVDGTVDRVDSTAPDNGSLVCLGGAGIALNLNVGGNVSALNITDLESRTVKLDTNGNITEPITTDQTIFNNDQELVSKKYVVDSISAIPPTDLTPLENDVSVLQDKTSMITDDNNSKLIITGNDSTFNIIPRVFTFMNSINPPDPLQSYHYGGITVNGKNDTNEYPLIGWSTWSGGTLSVGTPIKYFCRDKTMMELRNKGTSVFAKFLEDVICEKNLLLNRLVITERYNPSFSGTSLGVINNALDGNITTSLTGSYIEINFTQMKNDYNGFLAIYGTTGQRYTFVYDSTDSYTPGEVNGWSFPLNIGLSRLTKVRINRSTASVINVFALGIFDGPNGNLIEYVMNPSQYILYPVATENYVTTGNLTIDGDIGSLVNKVPNIYADNIFYTQLNPVLRGSSDPNVSLSQSLLFLNTKIDSKVDGVVGMYSQVLNTTVNQLSNNFQTMINATDSRGSLVRAADTHEVGSTFTLHSSGTLQAGFNQDIHLKFLLGTVILAETGVFSLRGLQINNINKWVIDLTFVIKSIGVSGIASISTSGTFTWNDFSSDIAFIHIFDGYNNTTYDTTQSLTFDLQASFVSGSPGACALITKELVIQKIF